MSNQPVHSVNRYSLVRSVPLGTATLHFVSGVTAADDAPFDVAKQTRVCFEKIDATLKGAGSRLEDVVKITVFLTDIREYAAYNAVRNEVFAQIDPPPASTGVEALHSVPSRRVEIEAIAVSGASARAAAGPAG